MSTTWILVSDAARGRLFEKNGMSYATAEVACYVNPDLRNLDARGDVGRSVPRSHESVGPARHVIEPHTSRREKSAHAFARMIASDLLEARARDRFDRLLLVAPPHFLGVLRQLLGNPEEAGVAGELSQDLVGLSTAELTQHLQEAFPREFHARPARAGP